MKKAELVKLYFDTVGFIDEQQGESHHEGSDGAGSVPATADAAAPECAPQMPKSIHRSQTDRIELKPIVSNSNRSYRTQTDRVELKPIVSNSNLWNRSG